MLMQVGGEGTRPTFFEMAATHHLPTSLRSALVYFLGVMAQRRPILHRVLDYSDEGYSFLMLLLELHSLGTADASFAEALYGLRRTPVEISSTSVPLRGDLGDAGSSPLTGRRPLTGRQRAASVLFLVGLPYLRYKAQAALNARRGVALQAALWGRGDLEDDGFLGPESTSEVNVLDNGIEDQHDVSSMRQQFSKTVTWALVHGYPWVHAAHEDSSKLVEVGLAGALFAYQLLYLLDATGFYTPALHCMGLQVRRASGQELMDAQKLVEERRNFAFGRLRGPSFVQAVQRVILRIGYTTLDYAQTGLIASVFLFKMVEWWYQSAEERVTAPSVYPPPPAPPPPLVTKNGLKLPADGKTCPLCLRCPRVNPALVAASGFVFCYTCIFHYVNQYKRCPVTLVPVGTHQILRLYQDA